MTMSHTWSCSMKGALHPTLNKSDSSLLQSCTWMISSDPDRALKNKEAVQSATRKDKHLHHRASVLI